MNCHVLDRSLLLALALGFASNFPSALAAHQISITWDPSPDSTAVSYNVYYGEIGGATNRLAAGASLRADLTDLGGRKHYFAWVTAVNSTGEESSPSDSVRYTTASDNTDTANESPLLDLIPDQSVSPGQILMYRLNAVDLTDAPANLTYSLLSGPTGASVDPHSGVFTWRVPKGLAATELGVTVSVSDDGSPVLTDIQQFGVRIVPKNQPNSDSNVTTATDGDSGGATESPTNISLAPAGLFRSVTCVSAPLAAHPLRVTLQLPAAAGSHYLDVSEDLNSWIPLGLATGSDEIVDGMSSGARTRFYRLRPAGDQPASL